MNVQGDNVTYKFPANAPAAQFLPPLICGDKAGGAGFNNATFGFNFSFGGSRTECFETAEAAQCVNGVIAIGAAFGKSLKVADAAIRCLAQMPTFKNAAKDAGQNPVKMAEVMVNSLETDYNLKVTHAAELEKERARVAAAGNELTQVKSEVQLLKNELAAADKRNEIATQLLNEERAKPPKVIRVPSAAKPAATTGTARIKLDVELQCGKECPPKK